MARIRSDGYAAGGAVLFLALGAGGEATMVDVSHARSSTTSCSLDRKQERTAAGPAVTAVRAFQHAYHRLRAADSGGAGLLTR